MTDKEEGSLLELVRQISEDIKEMKADNKGRFDKIDADNKERGERVGALENRVTTLEGHHRIYNWILGLIGTTAIGALVTAILKLVLN